MRAEVKVPALVGLALVVKAIVLAQLHDHPLLVPGGEMDSAYYVRLASEVASGDLLAGSRVFFASPLYIYFLALVFVIAGPSLLVARVVQIALGALAVGLIAATAARWFDRRSGRLAGALALLTGVFTFNEVLILQSALDPFLTALALFLVARAWTTGPSTSAAGWLGQPAAARAAAGFALGLASLNRPNVLAFALLAVVLTWCVDRRSGRRGPTGDVPGRGGPARALSGAAALAAGLAMALGPVAARNYWAGGEVALVSSHGGLNFYIGNHASADGTYRSVEGITPSMAGQDRDARRVAELALGRPLRDGEVSSYFYGRALDWIASEPRAALGLFARKLAYTLHAADLSLNYSYTYYSRDERGLLSALVVGPWLLVPLGLVGLVAATPRQGRSASAAWWAWTAFVPVYALSVAAFFVSGRYRMPLLVPLTIGSAAALLMAWDGWRAGTARRLLGGALVVGALALLANWPWRLDDGRANERAEMVLFLVDHGRDTEAERLMAGIPATHPQYSVLLARVGQAYLARGDTARAIAYLDRSLSAAPSRGDVGLLLGQALLDAGRPADALAPLTRAVDSGARTDVAAFDLARAHRALGQPEEARRALATIRVSGLDADSALAASRLAIALEDGVTAERMARRAVEASPRRADAHVALALALNLLGRRDDAIARLEEACRLEPADATAHLNLGVLYADSGRMREAEEHAAEALRLKPDYEQARRLLAAIHDAR